MRGQGVCAGLLVLGMALGCARVEKRAQCIPGMLDLLPQITSSTSHRVSAVITLKAGETRTL